MPSILVLPPASQSVHHIYQVLHHPLHPGRLLVRYHDQRTSRECTCSGRGGRDRWRWGCHGHHWLSSRVDWMTLPLKAWFWGDRSRQTYFIIFYGFYSTAAYCIWLLFYISFMICRFYDVMILCLHGFTMLWYFDCKLPWSGCKTPKGGISYLTNK